MYLLARRRIFTFLTQKKQYKKRAMTLRIYFVYRPRAKYVTNMHERKWKFSPTITNVAHHGAWKFLLTILLSPV